MLNNRYIRSALIVGTLTALLLGVYAFASGTDVPDGGKTGYGVEAIEGYTVTAYSFTQAANPVYIGSWTFTLNSAATTVKSRLGEDGTTGSVWVTCTSADSLVWLCTPSTQTTVTIADATNLQISAVKSVTP